MNANQAGQDRNNRLESLLRDALAGHVCSALPGDYCWCQETRTVLARHPRAAHIPPTDERTSP